MMFLLHLLYTAFCNPVASQSVEPSGAYYYVERHTGVDFVILTVFHPGNSTADIWLSGFENPNFLPPSADVSLWNRAMFRSAVLGASWEIDAENKITGQIFDGWNFYRRRLLCGAQKCVNVQPLGKLKYMPENESLVFWFADPENEVWVPKVQGRRLAEDKQEDGALRKRLMQ